MSGPCRSVSNITPICIGQITRSSGGESSTSTRSPTPCSSGGLRTLAVRKRGLALHRLVARIGVLDKLSSRRIEHPVNSPRRRHIGRDQ
jgi:hypothetical protein